VSLSETNDWTRPQALAISKEGYFKLENGKYGPVFPRTPACHGFTIIAKIKPGRVRIPAKPITDSELMAITIPSDADHRRSEATLGCSYHA
jgi:hypothetical protein